MTFFRYRTSVSPICSGRPAALLLLLRLPCQPFWDPFSRMDGEVSSRLPPPVHHHFAVMAGVSHEAKQGSLHCILQVYSANDLVLPCTRFEAQQTPCQLKLLCLCSSSCFCGYHLLCWGKRQIPVASRSSRQHPEALLVLGCRLFLPPPPSFLSLYRFLPSLFPEHLLQFFIELMRSMRHTSAGRGHGGSSAQAGA